jgi:hypothetical protein
MPEKVTTWVKADDGLRISALPVMVIAAGGNLTAEPR